MGKAGPAGVWGLDRKTMTLSALQEELQRKLNESQAEAQLVATIPCIRQLASVGADFKLRLVIDMIEVWLEDSRVRNIPKIF